MSFNDFTLSCTLSTFQKMTFHSFAVGLRSLAALSVGGLLACSAQAALPIHEAVVTPVAADGDQRAYNVCIKQRAAGEGQCLWTLRVEEDVPGALSKRRHGALASDDGLRVAVLLRKRRGDRAVDELWRFHQQMDPDFAVPGTPANRALVTRGKLIATGYPLAFGSNLALNRFALGDSRSVKAIDDHGSTLAVLHQAAPEAASLTLVARRGALAGFAERNGAGESLRIAITDLDALDADVYSTRALHFEGETAWNLERGWVALTDRPDPDATDSAPAETRIRAGAPITLRVIDLANQRVLFETARPGPAMHPSWIDADTLAWRVDETHTQTQKFDARSDIRLVQGSVRAQGDRLIFLPCRERVVLQIDETSSARELAALLRQHVTRSGRVFVEAFGTRLGSGISLDALVRASGDANACLLKPDRAIAEAHGRDPAWKLSATRQAIVFEEAGQAPVTMPYARLRWIEGRRTLSTRSSTSWLDLSAVPELCRDPLDGAVYGHRVVVRVGAPNKPRRELRGCGSFLQQGSDSPLRSVASR